MSEEGRARTDYLLEHELVGARTTWNAKDFGHEQLWARMSWEKNDINGLGYSSAYIRALIFFSFFYEEFRVPLQHI